MAKENYRSISREGFNELINIFAPAELTAPFTSHNLRKIFREETETRHEKITAKEHHPIDMCTGLYSKHKPTIAVTYTWDTDLRRSMPQLLQKAEIKISEDPDFIASKKPISSITFWIDICFIDQRQQDLHRDLEITKKIFRGAPYHVVLLSNQPLSRGWCLYEIGERCLSIMEEFKIKTADDLISVLRREPDNCRKKLKSQHSFSKSIRSMLGKKEDDSKERERMNRKILKKLPQLIGCKDTTNFRKDLIVFCAGEILKGMKTSILEDKVMLHNKLESMFQSQSIQSPSVLEDKDITPRNKAKSFIGFLQPTNQSQPTIRTIPTESSVAPGPTPPDSKTNTDAKRQHGEHQSAPSKKHPISFHSHKKFELLINELALSTLRSSAIDSNSVIEAFYAEGECYKANARTDDWRVAKAPYFFKLAVEYNRPSNITNEETTVHPITAELGVKSVEKSGEIIESQIGGRYALRMLKLELEKLHSRYTNGQSRNLGEDQGILFRNMLEDVRWHDLSVEHKWLQENNDFGWCYLADAETSQDLGKEQLLTKAARTGDTKAQSEILHRKGLQLELGDGVDPSDLAAKELYETAAQSKFEEAQVALGMFHIQGRGGLEKDWPKAVRYFSQAAEQGNARAQNLLGKCFEVGQGGLPQDFKQAAEWYRRSADQGWAGGQFDLGRMLLCGLGVSKDIVEAKLRLKLAADQGDRRAQVLLEYDQMYRIGNQLEREYHQGRDEATLEAARKLYELAARFDHSDAQAALGMFHMLGRGGLEQSWVDAVRLFRIAAVKENARAQSGLGRCYEVGRGGLARDLLAAVDLYQKSAEQGCADGQFNLGRCYQLGLGVSKDGREAERLLKAADIKRKSELGTWLSLDSTSFFDSDRRILIEPSLQLGQAGGNPKDFSYFGPDVDDECKKYFEAAQQGNARAQNLLGKCFEVGQGGLPQDFKQAAEWYRRSADQGWAGGQFDLGRMLLCGLGVSKDIVEAKLRLKSAKDQGDVRAHVLLEYDQMYRIGNQLVLQLEQPEQNKQKLDEATFKSTARKLYELAALFDHSDAQAALRNLGVEAADMAFDSASSINSGRSMANCLHLDQASVSDQEWKDTSDMFRLVASKNRVEFGNSCPAKKFQGQIQLVHTNLQAALRWCKLLADDMGWDGAQLELGRCFLLGLGLGKDVHEAIRLFQSSANQGNEEAKTLLTQAQAALEHAQKCKLLADAQLAFGRCYLLGLGSGKNILEAIRILKSSAEQENEEANLLLTQALAVREREGGYTGIQS